MIAFHFTSNFGITFLEKNYLYHRERADQLLFIFCDDRKEETTSPAAGGIQVNHDEDVLGAAEWRGFLPGGAFQGIRFLSIRDLQGIFIFISSFKNYYYCHCEIF